MSQLVKPSEANHVCDFGLNKHKLKYVLNPKDPRRHAAADLITFTGLRNPPG